MKKKWKSILAVLCAVTMCVPMVNMNGITKSGVSAEATVENTDNQYTMNFGEDGNDTYLQMENALDTVPQAVEAEVQMEGSTVAQEWNISVGNALPSAPIGFFADGNAKEYTTIENDDLGAGKTYFEFQSTQTQSQGTWKFDAIDVSRFTARELALSFWVYSSKAGKLFESGGIRVRDNASAQNGYQIGASEIYVDQGWNYITTAPMSTWTSVNDAPDKLTEVLFYNLKGSNRLIIGDIKIVVLQDPSEVSEWILQDGGDSYIQTGNTTNTITGSDGAMAPDGKPYVEIKLNSSDTSSFTTKNSAVWADISEYQTKKDQIALQFWIWSNQPKPITGGRMLLSAENGVATHAKSINILPANNITGLETGKWQLITIPLSKCFTDSTIDDTAVYQNGVRTFKFHGILNKDATSTNPVIIRIGAVKLVALDKQTEWEVKDIHSPSDGSDLFSGSLATEYYEGAGDGAEGPEKGKKVISFTSNSTQDTIDWKFDPISSNNYNEKNLAVSFWVYSQSAGDLFDGGALRILNSNNQLLYHTGFNGFALKAGWNLIVTPTFSVWDTKGNGGITSEKDIAKICFYNIKTNSAREMKLSDIKVVALERASEWTLREGDDLGFTPTGAFASAKTGGEYCNGKNIEYINFTSTARASSLYFKGLCVNSYEYKLDELELQFWVKSSQAGDVFKGGTLRISDKSGACNDSDGTYITDVNGKVKVSQANEWELIRIPLDSSTWRSHKSNDENYNYDYTKGIRSFRFFGVTSPSEGMTICIGEVKLVATNPRYEVQTTGYTDSTTENTNYTVFSNTNKDTEAGNKFGLFITREGYPALCYEDKQYTLQRNITGETAKTIRAGINGEGKVEFQIDGIVVGISDATVTLSSNVPTTGHSIGADANGNQLMKGSIANVKVYSGANAETCIGSWALNGQIDWVLNTLPDASGNQNSLKYVSSAEDADKNNPVIVSIENATAGTAPTIADTIMNGYAFAGWFKDETCTLEQALNAEDETTDAYAKFVDRKILTVKSMVPTGTKAEDTSASIRFVTTVDSLNYREAGFSIALDNGNPLTKAYTNVYDSLTGVFDDGETVNYYPTDFSTESTCFTAICIKSIPNSYFNSEWNVRAYWKTLDGTEVYGDLVTKTVLKGIETNSSSNNQ